MSATSIPVTCCPQVKGSGREFSLFAHMERLTADQSHEALYGGFIDLCKMADQGGMRAIWI